MRKILAVALLIGLWLVTSNTAAQQAELSRAEASSPSALAELILTRFVSGSPEEFAYVFPDEEGRSLVSQAVKDKQERHRGIARVVWSDQHRAILLLSGHVLTGNSGTDTIQSRAFSGFYEATESNGTWTIARRLPLADKNRIGSHDLDVTISPGEGLRVTDTMQITVGDKYG